MNVMEYIHYATSYWTGDALAWLLNLERINPNELQRIRNIQSKQEALGELLKLLLADFTGETFLEDTDYEKQLLKIQLCDLCMLEEFAAKYIGLLFHLKNNDQKVFWVKGFFTKIPYPWNNIIQERYDILRQSNTDENHNTGLLKKACMDTMERVCEQASAHKQMKNKIRNSKLGFSCCTKYTEDINTQFGCSPEFERKRTRNFKRRIKPKYRITRKKWKPEYKKKFRKKTSFLTKSLLKRRISVKAANVSNVIKKDIMQMSVLRIYKIS